MFTLLRLCLLIAAFLAGYKLHGWLAADACLDRGGQWALSEGLIDTGYCVGLKQK
jgi:hypothetical protein